MFRWMRVAAMALVGLATPFAIADAPSAKLVYERGAGADACPDEASLRRDVATELGHDPFVASAEKTVFARIVRDGQKLKATIELRDAAGKATGTRALESKQLDCKELASAVTLAITLALDPFAVPGKPSASIEPSASAPAPSVSAPPPEPPPSPPRPVPTIDDRVPPPPPPPPHGVRASLGAIGGSGFAPSTNLGVVAAVGWMTPRWGIDLEFRRDFPATAEVSTGTATSSLLAASIVPCLIRGPLGLCALASIGAVQASGGSVRTPRTASGLWLAAGVRVAVEVPLMRLVAIGLHADALAPLVRTALRLDGEDVWTTPALAGLVGARLTLHFE